MGDSISKKKNSCNFLTAKQVSKSSPSHFCECLSFRLQPFCTANRHMHAFIVKSTRDICIIDLTFKKRFIIKDALDPNDPLQNDASLPAGLANCNLIAYQWDLAVVQVYHRHGVQFYICDCSSQICTYRYMMCPCVKRKPGLCEAYFTSDRSILILKASDIYYNLFSTVARELDLSFIETVRLATEPLLSNHYIFPDSDITPFGICPDPDRPTEVYIAFWKNVQGFFPVAGLTRELDLSVVDIDRTTRHVLPGSSPINSDRFHIEYDFIRHIKPAHEYRSRFVNVQIPRNSNYIFLSTACPRSRRTFMPNAARACAIHVDLIEKKPNGNNLRYWNYDSYSGVQLDWPKLSPSGAYTFIGDEMFLAPNIGTLKPLSSLCLDLLTELVLPEDVRSLPLPKKLKDVIKYGSFK